MKTALILIIISITNLSFAQNDTVKYLYNDADDLHHQIIQADILELEFHDTTAGYSLIVPDWLKILNTGENGQWGGTLPAVNGIENSILISSYDKAKFESFEEFKDIYITGNEFGKAAKYNADFIWFGQNELIEIDRGLRRKIFVRWRGLIYHSHFVAIETSKSYLWIQFTASPTTYEANIGKFEELFSTLKY